LLVAPPAPVLHVLVAGARSIDLAPAAQGGDQAALPEVVIVFAQVVGSLNFSYRRRSETHAVRKAITRCMLQMLDELPETEEGRDGYLCRIQEADLKYMVSFKAAHVALQWCMLVQVRAFAGMGATCLTGAGQEVLVVEAMPTQCMFIHWQSRAESGF
jgi:hypothetical protein